jgi:hypothetical protein
MFFIVCRFMHNGARDLSITYEQAHVRLVLLSLASYIIIEERTRYGRIGCEDYIGGFI